MILIIKKRLKMRRNQLYIPLFIATLAIVGSSCNDFLDELPDNRTELNSEQKIAKMLVSAYPEGSANELFELYSDNTDDNSARYSYYKLSEEECYNWKDTQEEYQDTPTNLWETHYIAIASANMALEEIEKRGKSGIVDAAARRGSCLSGVQSFCISKYFL